MSFSLQSHPKFAGRSGPVLVIIADGFGVGPAAGFNAISEAETPFLDSLTGSENYCTLAAHGLAVGLPSDADMGNSEVGHNALGAGRIFAQGAKLVNQALADTSLFSGSVWQELITVATKRAMASKRMPTLHFIGLHSDGNVHSHNQHLYQMLHGAAAAGVESVAVHILLDGRDVAARSALTYISETEEVLSGIMGDYPGYNYRVASGGGRMSITMDRYEADWKMVKDGYNVHTHGIGRGFSTARAAVETMYRESDAGDQYLDAFVIVDSEGNPVGQMNDGDAVVLYNFRGDRAVQISRAYEEPDFDDFDRCELRQAPEVTFAGMLQYDGDLQIPKKYLVDPPAIDRTMGEYLCAEGIASFAVSETQKFGHVTYFWNGNRSGYIDEELETYIEIPSDVVEFNKTPAMKLREITAATIDLLKSGRFRFGRINFPNGDMVGHTGDLGATIEAVEVIEECTKLLASTVGDLGGVLVFTADHGNADVMFSEIDGVRTPVTSHTLNPVPFAIIDSQFDGEYSLSPPDDAGLSHVAATLFNLLGYEAPDQYQPSLLQFR